MSITLSRYRGGEKRFLEHLQHFDGTPAKSAEIRGCEFYWRPAGSMEPAGHQPIGSMPPRCCRLIQSETS